MSDDWHPRTEPIASLWLRLEDYIQTLGWSQTESQRGFRSFSFPADPTKIVVVPPTGNGTPIDETLLSSDELDRHLSQAALGEEPADIQVVLPESELWNYLRDAVAVIAAVQERPRDDVRDDVFLGPADRISIRFTPPMPSGQAPLALAEGAFRALRTLLVGAAASFDSRSLVLPPRRPQRAQTIADRVRVQTRPGSFVISASMPLFDVPVDVRSETELPLDLPPNSFGRRVVEHLESVVPQSLKAADAVLSGTSTYLTAFSGSPSATANATELEALGQLGGDLHSPYQLLIKKAPTAGERAVRSAGPTALSSEHQSIFLSAAEVLRTEQPLPESTVTGLVVRLYRQGNFGPGEVTVQGVYDDSGRERRIRVELDERDYERALEAHKRGDVVAVTGDIAPRGNRLAMTAVSDFVVTQTP